MHATRPVVSLRLLMPIALLTLLAGLLLLPDQAHAQTTPTISGMGSLSFPEGTTTSEVLHTYTATDTAASTTFTWTLEGVDAGDFIIDAGELKFASVPDYEVPTDTPSTGQTEGDNVYNVTVKVADNESTPMSATLPVTVTVTNVNEAQLRTDIQQRHGRPHLAGEQRSGGERRWGHGCRHGQQQQRYVDLLAGRRGRGLLRH